MKPLTTRSKIRIYWTTNPADMGYDGKPTYGTSGAWKSGTPATITSPCKAVDFAYELGQRVGQGTYKSIAYFHGDREVAREELQDLVY